MTIGLYQDSAPIVVYRGNVTDNLYYQFSEDNGGNWSKRGIIPGIRARDIRDTDHDDYSMATDGAGNVHLICSGFLSSDTAPDTALKLLHLVWNGRSWSAPEIIATDSTYPELEKVTIIGQEHVPILPEWPRAVISSTDLHVTWFTRNEQDLFKSDNASYQVWYSVRHLDSPAVAPLTLFTSVPTAAPATPTPSPAPVPTPTLPPDVINARAVDGSLAWEGPGLVTLGAAVLSVITLLALAVGVHLMMGRLRRRARG